MYDEFALVLAGKLQQRVAPAQVLLFGSRARGDWTEESDIDLMVLDEEALLHGRQSLLSGELGDEAQRIYGYPVPVQLFSLTLQEFDQAKVAAMHIAGGAQREGLTVEGKYMPRIKQNNPWPDVKQRLRVAQESLYTAFYNEGGEQHKASGLEAYHALENALKAYASALGLSFSKAHNLELLANHIHTAEHIVDLPARQWLEDMNLLRYRGPYNADYELFDTPTRILIIVQDICGRIAARVLTILDKQPEQVGYSHWLADRPFGGMEDVDLAEFNLERKLTAERKKTILEFAHLWLTENQIGELSQWLDDTPIEDWPPVKDLLASWQKQDNLGEEEYRG